MRECEEKQGVCKRGILDVLALHNMHLGTYWYLLEASNHPGGFNVFQSSVPCGFFLSCVSEPLAWKKLA